jgi:glucose-1-phosphate cytidylyltransferase
MQAVILAGGLGTRFAEETETKPKPMIEIGGKPILWHIMKIYSSYGINDFIICLGYKGYVIKEYFANYFLHMSDVTFDMSKNSLEIHQKWAEPWKVTLVDTGDNTQTGGRLKRVKDYIKGDTFCFTYGDGLGDVNISELVKFHELNASSLATLTSVSPPGRFGSLQLLGDRVDGFIEKPSIDYNSVNGGFFVLSRGVFDYIEGDSTIWEVEPMQRMAREEKLYAYKHRGFWQPMDTLREKIYLEQLWNTGKASWKTWK